MPEYRVVRFFTKYGKALSILSGVFIFSCFLIGFAQGHIGGVWLGVGAIVGVAVGALVRLLADLTRLISDMLIPQ